MYLGEDLTCYKHVRTFLLARSSSLTHPFSVCAKFEPSYNLFVPLLGHCMPQTLWWRKRAFLRWHMTSRSFQARWCTTAVWHCLTNWCCKIIVARWFASCYTICINMLDMDVWFAMFGECMWRHGFCTVQLKVSFPTSSQWRQKLGSWFDGFVFLYIQKIFKRADDAILVSSCFQVLVSKIFLFEEDYEFAKILWVEITFWLDGMKTVAVHEERSFSLGSTLQVPEGAGKPDKQAGSANLLRCGVKRVDGLLKTSTGKHSIVVCPCKCRGVAGIQAGRPILSGQGQSAEWQTSAESGLPLGS